LFGNNVWSVFLTNAFVFSNMTITFQADLYTRICDNHWAI